MLTRSARRLASAPFAVPRMNEPCLALSSLGPFHAIMQRLFSSIKIGRGVCASGRCFSSSDCLLEHLSAEEAGVAVIYLNRPSVKNALGASLMALLKSHLEQLKASKSCRVLIVASRESGMFCSGADLKERSSMGLEEIAPTVKNLRSTFTELERLPFPTIAAMDGSALGGGLELALACDFRIASPKAMMGLPETKLAIMPAAGGSQRLPRLVGSAKAKDLIFTGRLISAEEACRIGLVTEIHASPLERSRLLAKELLQRGPVALKMAKLAIVAGMEVEMNSALAIEEMCYAQLIPTEDRLEGLAAFREKRPPLYKGK